MYGAPFAKRVTLRLTVNGQECFITQWCAAVQWDDPDGRLHLIQWMKRELIAKATEGVEPIIEVEDVDAMSSDRTPVGGATDALAPPSTGEVEIGARRR